ncbi:hypothetical protein N7478_001090 [Penicillium angulare]|uniref:uncharacterized protein n=1 Tax=Penicillium angulare TaxID=116970 RepID=UPI002540F16E|nr:uncharacterized protein N7478_001090 [Penicillium angulare]KAJ5291839.1 hypothetical protein N7478_001090 [Penicillium angulare]
MQELGMVRDNLHRYIVPVTGGTLNGSGMDFHISGPGNDWILLDTISGIAHLDVRTQAQTAEGKSVSIRFPGTVKMDEDVALILRFDPKAKSTNPGDHYFWTTPTFETSEQSFQWMEQHCFLGIGYFNVQKSKMTIVYDIYKLL